ncbi:hypothetical protein Aspvir_003242 [Aspergillus viridinutans]|uniref:Secreted protein CSS2 C-terminal domain-containing protein n=1 Tax=Aspergillus viridinutans TaxID=75553 RepID=A0A9P3C9C9_ASPVI|nr:uncharacterized protein Aspvir_003242 [Aspergillus viridinutans]GIK07576.1 hypothetical protein Aspvir_003242 [Aspergillus viridinutans]
MPTQRLPQLFFRFFPSFITFTLILCNTYQYYVAYEDCSLGNPLSLPTLAHGSPSPTSINGQSLPERWHQIDLVDASGVEYPEYAQSLVMGLTGNITDVDLHKRRPDDVCRYIITPNACLGIGSYVVGWAKSMAQIIKDLLNNHNCGVIDGTYRDIRYVFYASGRNCDTTSQQDTIAGAINKYMQKVDN